MSTHLALVCLCSLAGVVIGVFAVSAIDHRMTVAHERKLHRWSP